MKPKHLLLFCCILGLLKVHAQRPFITIWNTSNPGVSDSAHIIFYATGDNFHIGWVDMSNAVDTGNAVGMNGADTISFTAPGIYKIYITPGSGSFSAITQNIQNDSTNSDCYKLVSIEQWGDINWSTFNAAFANCDSMIMNATDIPILNSVTDMSAAFYNCISLITDAAMNDWDVSNVTDMHYMFEGAVNFNQPIDSWNVSKVTNMYQMFSSAISFNQPIENWDVSSVTNMGAMFGDARSFNQSIGSWNVNNVTDMSGMFQEAEIFNQPIGNWNVNKVTDMSYMFSNAFNFNQPVGNWNVNNVTNMNFMFEDATSFSQPLGNWNVINVTSMIYMFDYARSFNQPINSWNVSNVTLMIAMFDNASNFNQPLNNWNVSNVMDMDAMFTGASNFNQPLDKWDVSNVKNMEDMFYLANNFNQPIGNWNVSNVITMRFMFSNAKSFNQPLNNWDVSKVKDMSGMFSDAVNFNQPLNNWKSNSLEYVPLYYTYSALNMFDNSGLNCANYSTTLRGWAANTSLSKNQFLGAANLIYDSAFAKAAHDSLIQVYGWAISGDTMMHCSGILPVNFISFNAVQQGNAALLNWKIANEINVKGYAVEKSANGFNYNSIGFVAAKENKQTNYIYTDNNLVSGSTYYRIKEGDNDGKFMYSSVQKIEYLKFAWRVNGNPINNSSVTLMLNKPANVSIQIISSTGSIIKTINKGILIAGNYSIPLNIDNVSAGLYLVRLMVDDKAYSSNMVKQ